MHATLNIAGALLLLAGLVGVVASWPDAEALRYPVGDSYTECRHQATRLRLADVGTSVSSALCDAARERITWVRSAPFAYLASGALSALIFFALAKILWLAEIAGGLRDRHGRKRSDDMPSLLPSREP